MHIPIEKKEKIIKELFTYTIKPDNWEIYMPLDGGNTFILFRPICSKCKKPWSVDRKECFHCKTKYFRTKVCPECNSIYPENVPNCKNGHEKKRIKKICLGCGKIDDERDVVFVPVTFCWYCGNRKNEFEFKVVSL